MPKDSKLLMCIHSNSLNEAAKDDREVVDALLACSGIKECLVLATPTTDTSVLSILNPEIVRLSYENRGSGAFVATHERARTLFHNSIPSAMITDLCKCEKDSTEFKEIKGAFHDLLAFEAISRWHKDESIFVTQYHNLLDRNVWIQKRFDVKILSFSQALEYCDLYLKKHDLYYANPHLKRTNGKAFHYWFLLKDLVPKFAEAWRIFVFGKKVIQNGPNIWDALAGLADRFQNALYSSDRIALEYAKRPVNSTEWEMLHNFNYFCMLATGIFDSLAWLTVYRYMISIRHPYHVSIRIAEPRSRGAKFVAHIARQNPALTSFIALQQDFINMFYPMRDATQHREPAGGALFENANEGWIASLASVKQDAVDIIKRNDKNDYPFTKWGLLNISGIPHMMDPYRFTRKALRELMAFANTYIELLDFPSLLCQHQDLVNMISDAESKEPEPAFIARTYWRRDSHLPILFRNR